MRTLLSSFSSLLATKIFLKPSKDCGNDVVDKFGLQDYTIDFKSKTEKTIEKIEKVENLQKISEEKLDKNLMSKNEKKPKFKRKKFKKKKIFKKKN